jgi:hypothetical protein
MKLNFLTQYTDQQFAGKYHFGRCLGCSTDGAVYETTVDGTPAVIKLRQTETPELLEQWKDAAQLNHPHLIRILASGEDHLDEMAVKYVVMERADETLAGVLAERPLSEKETREMLEPALSALDYLHGRGYIHGALKASNVLAAGDTLKLASDTVHRNADGAPDDAWGVGVLLVQAVTGHFPELPDDGPYILRNAPDVFTEIARHALDVDASTRWTIPQIAKHLNPKWAPAAPVAVPPPPPVAVRPVSVDPLVNKAAPAVTPQTVPPAAAKPVPAVATAERPVRATPPLTPAPAFTARAPQDRFSAPEGPPKKQPLASWLPVEEAPRDNRKFIYGGLGAAALALLLIFTVGRKKDVTPAVMPTPVPAAAVGGSSPVRNIKPSPVERASRTQSEAPLTKHLAGWDVVVASYADRGAAEHRAQKLAKRWRNFKPEVVAEPGARTLYLVLIGQGLTQDRATEIRRRAVSSGMPRDTYVRRSS